MNLTRDRVRSIGWMSVLLICGAVTLALTLRVNAVKSQVYATERKIVGVQQEINFLETEFQTRSNQQALAELNDLEFGYKAPGAGQYIEGERQLAALGKAPGPGAPAPIRYANAEVTGENATSEGTSLLAMVSPVSGATAAAVPEAERAAAKQAAANKGDGRDPERSQLVREAGDLSRRLAEIKVAEAAH